LDKKLGGSGSILGLPSEPVKGPLVLGESHGRDSASVSSLSSYGSEDDFEEKSNKGTLTLIGVIGFIIIMVLAYTFITPLIQ